MWSLALVFRGRSHVPFQFGEGIEELGELEQLATLFFGANTRAGSDARRNGRPRWQSGGGKIVRKEIAKRQ